MPHLLVLYYSQGGATARMAREIALGAESTGLEARLRRLESPKHPEPDNQVLVCDAVDLADCAGLALGSPTRFGNMAWVVKEFLDSTGRLWMQGGLKDKPACVFTSCSTLHGGHESTLLSMMIPLLHHGMLLCGLPFDATLRNTASGGSPYGVTHWAKEGSAELSCEEQELCRTQGKRLAQIASVVTPMGGVD